MITNAQDTGHSERVAVIRQLVAERLFRRPEEVALGSRLIADLGADSLDFVDFQFQIEKRFGVQFAPGDFFDASFRWVTKEGFLKREAPEPDKVPIGEALNRITVETLLRVVEEKLATDEHG